MGVLTPIILLLGRIIMGDFITIILSIVESLIILLFFLSLNASKEYLKNICPKFLVFVVFYTMISFWATTYLPIGIHTIAILILTSLILSLITRSNIFNTAIIVIITTLFISLVDTIVSTVFITVLDIDLNYLLHDADLYTAFSLTTKTIQLIFCTSKIMLRLLPLFY
jgi:large-conductance mechanosensitive channel